MRTFIAAAFAAVASAELLTSEDYDFMHFIAKYGKRYATVEEFVARKGNFLKFYRAARDLNSRNLRSTHGVNAHSDKTDAEWKNMLGLRSQISRDWITEFENFEGYSVPTSVDWRDQGVVNPVKDQGQCGSCWAFSCVAALESAHAIKTGELLQLSEQQLVDCSRDYGNNGCGGGWFSNAYDYLAAGNSLETEDEYPYQARDQSCKDTGLGTVTCSGTGYVRRNPDSIKAAIAQQPVNVAVAAGNYVFQSYTSGILMESSGCPTAIDHGITAVGYGVESGVEFLIVRNSWGSSWGEGGYIRMELADDTTGTCGVNGSVEYPKDTT